MAAEFPVVFALYPRVTQLDFTGPHEVVARLPGAQCVLASASGGDIEADGGVVFTRVGRLADIERCALICVPVPALVPSKRWRIRNSLLRSGALRRVRAMSLLFALARWR